MLMNTEELKKLPHTMWDLKIFEGFTGRHVENIFRCAVALAKQEGQKELPRLRTEHFTTIIEATYQPNISGLLLQNSTTSSSGDGLRPDQDQEEQPSIQQP